MADQSPTAPAAQQVQQAADVSKLQVTGVRQHLQPAATSRHTPEAAPVACGIRAAVAGAQAAST